MSEAAFEYGIEFSQNIAFLMGIAVTIYCLKQDKLQAAVITLLIASFLAALSIELTEDFKNASYQPSIQNLIYNMIGFGGLTLLFLLLVRRFNPSYLMMLAMAFGLAILLAIFQSNNDPLNMRLLHGSGIGIGAFFAAATIKWQFNGDTPLLKVFFVWFIVCILFSLPIYLIDYSGLVLER